MEIPEMNDTNTDDLRDELLTLANRGKIRYSEKYIKGAKPKQLERIKHEYVRKQTEIVDEQISKYIIGGFSSLLKNLEYVDEEECEEMKNTLLNNDMVKKDLNDISGIITSNIKYIGLATLAVVAGGYVFKTFRKNKTEDGEQTNNPTSEREE